MVSICGNITIKDVERALLGKLFTLKGNENKKIVLTYLVTSVYKEYDNAPTRWFNPEKYILVIKIPRRKNLERAITLSKFLEKFREIETDENETREAYKKKLRDELNYKRKVHPDKRKTLKDRPRAPQTKDLDLNDIETYKKVSYSTIRILLSQNKVPEHLVPDVKKIRKEIWNRTKADVTERSVLKTEEMNQANLLSSGKKDYQSMVEKFLDENPEKRTDFLKGYIDVCEYKWD